MKKMKKVLHEILGKEMTPGEVVRGARVDAGVSQEEMAEITGIQRTNISAIENNRISMTSHYAEIFAAVLKIHPADILYPNRQIKKSSEILEIEKRASSILKNRTVS